MVNIIYQNDRTIRLTQFDSTSIYNLNDLKFYLPSDKKILTLFCVLKNDTDKDVIKLTYIPSDNKNYNCYEVSNENKTCIKTGETALSLFGINEDNTTITSEYFNLNVNVDDFNTFNEIYVIYKLNSEVANYYNKINELTKINIELYSKMQVLAKGGA